MKNAEQVLGLNRWYGFLPVFTRYLLLLVIIIINKWLLFVQNLFSCSWVCFQQHLQLLECHCFEGIAPQLIVFTLKALVVSKDSCLVENLMGLVLHFGYWYFFDVEWVVFLESSNLLSVFAVTKDTLKCNNVVGKTSKLASFLFCTFVYTLTSQCIKWKSWLCPSFS